MAKNQFQEAGNSYKFMTDFSFSKTTARQIFSKNGGFEL